jgi:hypothetical protein
MLKITQFSLGLMLTLSLGSAFACTEGEEGCSLDKTDFVEVMKYRMPEAICTTDSPYLQCSDASQAQCKALASKGVDECLAENDKKIPKLLNRPESGKWGAAIGDCTGGKLFRRIGLKADKSASCREYLQPAATPTAELPYQRAEKIINASPRLRQLDDDMKSLYRQIEAETMGIDGETGQPINPISAEQISWENSVRNQCESAACIEKAYIERIEQMKKNWKEALK